MTCPKDPPSSPVRDDLDPLIAAELAKQWRSIMPIALNMAYSVSRSRDAAEELIQEAYLAIRRGSRKWDPEAYPSLAAYVCLVVGSLWANRQASARVRREAPLAPEGYDEVPASQPDPEQLNVMKQGHSMRARLLTALYRGGWVSTPPRV